MRLTGTPSARSDDRRRALSLSPSTVGMVAITNSVVSVLRNSAFTSKSCALSASSFFTASSWSSFSAPKSDLTAEVADESFWRRRTTLPIERSRKSGSERRRSVWPVGAVSKTMRVKREYSSALMNCTTLAMASASSSPGGGVSSSSPSRSSASESAIPPSPTCPRKSSTPLPPSRLTNSANSPFASSGSSSIPYSIPSVPSTNTGFPPDTSWASESDSECAGSVDTTNVA
mmetsp:Transcript_18786/g.61353  ORF Transcript_18786/g.61353 Transcript_18786/m.61353 type:complete len:231 (+) Transcript_18786:410-1102(+)